MLRIFNEILRLGAIKKLFNFFFVYFVSLGSEQNICGGFVFGWFRFFCTFELTVV